MVAVKNSLILGLFFILCTSHGISQGEHNVWYFGGNAGLDFNNNNGVQALANGSLYQFSIEACATCCNTSGDLLFYTNGVTIWNKNHVTMPNGSGLNGHHSTTQTIIVPRPNDPNQYFVFTLPKDHSSLTNYVASYSIIDLTLDGGLGDVTAQKNVPFMTESTEKVTAVAHANGEDYWILLHKRSSGIYVSYLLNSSGLSTTPIESNIGVLLSDNDLGAYTGYMKASLSGSIVAAAHGLRGTEVLKFDNNSGIFTPWLYIQENHYGVEFSPSERFLYASDGITHILHQFDLNAGTPQQIVNSIVTLGDNSNWIGHGLTALQIGPDSNIYVGKSSYPYLNVINEPNELGTLCSYQEDAIFLNNRSSLHGLPPAMPTFKKIVKDSVITTNDTFNIQMPNIFTPNNDNINDQFITLSSQGIISNQGEVYNRWGQIMYAGDLLQKGWNGKTLHGKICPGGVYFWHIKATTASGQILEKKGFVHLVKD